MARQITIGLLALFLVACGAPTLSQQDAQATAFVRIDARLGPPTKVPPPAEPSHGLGMSRAAWEAKSGFAVEKGALGEKYGNGIEASFSDDVLWRIDFAFQESNYPTPETAHNTGKAFIPDDAKLVKTYRRDVTTVNLYHSVWLAKRLKADMFTGGDPGDFTLQYNVFDGKVHALIIAPGNNP